MTGALAWLEAEHDNVRAALRWALDAGEAALALRLTGAVFRFWMVRGYVEEGRRWLAAALDAGRDQPPALRAKVLNGAGSLAHTAGDPAAAIALYEEALAPRHEIESKRFIAGCLHNLGIALVHGRGDLARAEDALLEALTLYREAGDAWGVGLSLKTLGQVAVLRGAAAEGIARLEESVATYRRLESGWGLAIALIEFGNALLEAGDAALAWARQAEGLALAWADGDLLNITYALEGIARASLALGQPALAARLCGAAEALREAGGAPGRTSTRRRSPRPGGRGGRCRWTRPSPWRCRRPPCPTPRRAPPPRRRPPPPPRAPSPPDSPPARPTCCASSPAGAATRRSPTRCT